MLLIKKALKANPKKMDLLLIQMDVRIPCLSGFTHGHNYDQCREQKRTKSESKFINANKGE